MSATVYDGKALVSKLSRRIRREADQLRSQHHIDVGLGILLITGDQVAMADSGKIVSLAEQSGIEVQIERVAKRNVARKFYPTLEEYAASPFIQGIYIQLPIPTELVPMQEIMKRLPPEKDVGGLHFVNRGMSTFTPYEVGEQVHPPEVLAAVEALKQCGFNFRGGKVVVVGSEATAGLVKILAGNLFDKGCNVKVLRYSNISRMSGEDGSMRLKDMSTGGREPDGIVNPEGEAVITWANHSRWLSSTRLAPQSIVIDMGYKFSRGVVSGDCDFLSVSRTAKVVTPVPGGVRNIAHAIILQNLINLINRQIDMKLEKPGEVLKRRF